MVGLIWMVQAVHYPGFRLVGRDGWLAYQAHHTSRTGLVTGPAMLIEAALAIALFFVAPIGTSPMLLWLGFGLLLVNWLSTALVQMPTHSRLLLAHDEARMRLLVATNWLRTVAWTVRGVIAAMILLGPGFGHE